MPAVDPAGCSFSSCNLDASTPPRLTPPGRPPKTHSVVTLAAHRRARWLAAILAVLLLVPVLLKGHAHADEIAPADCAVCIVTQHAPAVAATTGATVDVVIAADPLPLAAAPAYRGVDRPAPSGRGPPRATRRIAS